MRFSVTQTANLIYNRYIEENCSTSVGYVKINDQQQGQGHISCNKRDPVRGGGFLLHVFCAYQSFYTCETSRNKAAKGRFTAFVWGVCSDCLPASSRVHDRLRLVLISKHKFSKTVEVMFALASFKGAGVHLKS